MKYDNQLRYASDIIKKYDGRIPLAAWLKDFFRVNKQMGSTDRKTVSEMVYGFYRLGHNEYSSIEERILAYINYSDKLPLIKEYFSSTHQLPVGEYSVDKIFPFGDFLSKEVDAKAFAKSFLIQPDLFIRIRPGQKENVLRKLYDHGTDYYECGDDCIAVPNATKIDAILEINREAVIQDRSSQRTSSFIKEAAEKIPQDPSVWDCCAASGGKAILAADIIKQLKLTVSDIRESIIQNLHKRFGEAGITDYDAFVADLTDNHAKIPASSFDCIIADLPCSGSGTWARTPEQLYFFKKERIAFYSDLQKKIISRVIPLMKSGSALLYITCSVFEKENEEVVEFISSQYNLEVIKSELIKGYQHKADTLFAALFINR